MTSDRIQRDINALQLDRDPRVARLLHLLSIDPEDQHVTGLLEAVIQRARAGVSTGAPYPFIPNEQNQIDHGELTIATTTTGVPVRITLNRTTTRAPIVHTVIAGPSNAGKTTNAATYARGIIKQNIAPVLLIDKHQAFRHLLADLHDQIHVVKWHDLRINPYQAPPDCPPPRWNSMITTLFATLYERHDSATVLDQAVRHLGAPTWHDIIEVFERKTLRCSGKQAQFATSLTYLLKRIASHTDPLYDCIDSTHYQFLQDHHVILEVDRLPQRELAFLLHHYFIWQEQAPPATTLRQVIIIDEAQTLLTHGLAERFCDLRHLGLHVVAIAQNPSTLAKQVLQNSSLFMTVGPITTYEDKRTIGDLASLTKDQLDALTTCQQGEGIIRMTAGPYPHAFPVIYPDSPSGPCPEQLRATRTIAALQHYPTTPRTTTPSTPITAAGSKHAQALGDAIYWDLHHKRHLDSRLTDWYVRAALSRSQGDRAKTALITEGYYEEHDIPLGTRGKPRKILWPTPTWYAYRNVDPLQWTGKTRSITHKYLQHLIASYHDDAVIEGQLRNGKLVDVLLKQSHTAIEISHTTTPAEELRNITRDLEASEQVILLTTKAPKPYANRITASITTDRVRVLTVHDYLKEIAP